MVYLNEIVRFLNEQMKGRLSAYPTAEYNTIATYATKVYQNSTIVYPSFIEIGKKGAEILSIDIKAPFYVYHRLGATTFTKVVGNNYGDGDVYEMSSSTEVQMIFWGVRDKINTYPEQFANIISDQLPDFLTAPELSQNGINRINITPISINYDQRAIFQQEYQGVRYFLGPELFLFSIRYRIEGTYTKGCTNKCEC